MAAKIATFEEISALTQRVVQDYFEHPEWLTDENAQELIQVLQMNDYMLSRKMLRKDLIAAMQLLSKDEVRYLVDMYYEFQLLRIRADAKIRASSNEKPNDYILHLRDQFSSLESEMRRALLYFAQEHPTGAWSLQQHGIGPVISAGLLAHIDIHKAPHVGHIYSFAGIAANQTWHKGERRPWNAKLKRLCYLIGQSFIKTSGSPNSYYGKLYLNRKQKELDLNEQGHYAELAAKALQSPSAKSMPEDLRAIYQQGKLPTSRITLRAARYATKMFLAHWFEVEFWNTFKTQPPTPYPFAYLNHDPASYVPPPLFTPPTHLSPTLTPTP